MEPAVSQSLLAAVIGLGILVIVVRLSRRGQLSFRYTLGWIGVATIGVLAGLFVPLVEPIAQALGFSAAALLALVAVVFFMLIAIQLSISISGLQKQHHTLTEEVARLRHEAASADTDRKSQSSLP